MTKRTPQQEAKKCYEEVKKRGTIYVWGMNYDTIISKESIDKAYEDNHSSTYNRAYYDNKLKEGKGKPGADCSGMHYKLSGYDTTAQGYYKRCERKGTFDLLPITDLVVLFKGSSTSNIKHTGIYLGNGMCIHMKSSASNCVYESVNNHGWTHWGYADFIDYSTQLKDNPSIITRNLRTNCKGVDVKLLQKTLNSLKYNCGEVDGIFGKNTNAAVKKFQKDNKLDVDGIVGKNTCKKLGFIYL